MSKTFEDKTGAEVTVSLNEAAQAYEVAVADGAVAGSAFFLPGPDAETERIFHHTVVDEQFGGRGLSKFLVAEALDDSRERGVTVVPVCPLFVTKLQEAGDDYAAQGGKFRNATGADFDIVKRQA
ncbi:MAG: GNAT family N-acetyltransferase [Brevibacterium aurantiacum]|uniref:GNAT family N-acetyltransferase n=1 Tax=Brevibacterium aurantiacum TaxID=273384 RepID=UPI000BB90DB7|nr:GNAT family N-acetyltransferase [Brevibacterium aurantiacum]MDN5586018.1 N-acetyltransferase [Brevibacterium sp.]PCC56209.1 N-acetyltransferase [Brevibacterium aurantiacum]